MLQTQSVQDLVANWRDKAETFREYGAEVQAQTLERCAAELEAGTRDQALQPLTLADAADLSGYSTDHLGRLIRDGRIPNAGRTGAPRIARRDLPLKSGHVASVTPIREVDRTQIVRSVIDEGVG